MLKDLDLRLQMSTAAGPLVLEGEEQDVYSLEAGSLAEIATTWRKTKVKNPHVEGEYLVHAERDNQTVPVNVWVEGRTIGQVRHAAAVLEQAFGQLQYSMTLTAGSYSEVWQCMGSDTVMEMSHLFLHSPRALVKVQVERLPQIKRSAA